MSLAQPKSGELLEILGPSLTQEKTYSVSLKFMPSFVTPGMFLNIIKGFLSRD